LTGASSSTTVVNKRRNPSPILCNFSTPRPNSWKPHTPLSAPAGCLFPIPTPFSRIPRLLPPPSLLPFFLLIALPRPRGSFRFYKGESKRWVIVRFLGIVLSLPPASRFPPFCRPAVSDEIPVLSLYVHEQCALAPPLSPVSA